MNKSYTMHNIVLGDGTETMPGKPVLAHTDEVKRMIEFAKLWCPKCRVVDLGAGEGGHAIAFARVGFEVMAVEPRQDNIEKIIHAAEGWVKIYPVTVEEFLSGPFCKGPLVLCLGLLYHLPNPTEVLRRACSMASALVLSTHFALEEHWQYDKVTPVGSWMLKRIYKRVPGLFSHRHYGLSAIRNHEGRRGRWYTEYPRGFREVDGLTHSSVHNHKSFWLTAYEIMSICSMAGMYPLSTRINTRDQNFTGYFLAQR